MMRIYTKSGDLAFKTFTFPDGQPHFKLETYEREFNSVTVELSLRSPSDVFLLLLVSSVLRANGYAEVNLDIRYLLGARMDRAIDTQQPFTLETVARLINGAGFSKVRLLDVHSEVATRLIRNSENVLPHKVVDQVICTINPSLVAIPDTGAYDRVSKLVVGMPYFQCFKTRDMQTGNLSGFKVGVDLNGSPDILIVDDICDGGGTFVGLAKELRKAGAKKVYLFVTHGIFSKGLPLEGIDRVFTTDSFDKADIRDGISYQDVVVVPVSMKDMK